LIEDAERSTLKMPVQHQPIFEEYRHKPAKCKINAFFATAKTFQKRVLLGDYRLIGILTSRIRMSADNDTKNVRPTLSTWLTKA